MALRKLTPIKESSSLEFRFEAFNTFNQFDGANSVDGNINEPTSTAFEIVRVLCVALSFIVGVRGVRAQGSAATWESLACRDH
jgi:hypothetical protein